ncbi:MAG: hypothetical protein P1U34_00625 [Coxiellaceae bacterium]|nr:hypothetical protein [Coxiellaceae bacterium]
MNKKAVLAGVSVAFVMNVVGSLYSHALLEVSEGDALTLAGIAAARQAGVTFGAYALATLATCCCCVLFNSINSEEPPGMGMRQSFALGYLPLAAASVLASFALNALCDKENQLAREFNPLLPLGVLLLAGGGYKAYTAIKELRASCARSASTAVSEAKAVPEAKTVPEAKLAVPAATSPEAPGDDVAYSV